MVEGSVVMVGDIARRAPIPLMLLLVVVITGASGCAAPMSQRVDPDTPSMLGDTTTDSQDLRTIAQRMARSLVTVQQISNAASPPRIAFLDVNNRTNQIIDKEIFLNSIRTLLIQHSQGRVIFLDRARINQVVAERELKRRGEVGASERKILSGVDFFLTGELNALDKVEGPTRQTYTRYSFRLTDAESADIVWEDAYEVKKVGRRGVFDQ
jgi:PBP1b-binding outer membrane lipoprotein LpoB